MKASSYGPGKGGKPQAPAGGTGIGGFSPGASSSAPVAEVAPPSAPEAPVEAGPDTLIAQEPVLTAINELNANMVANQEATISVLYDINTSVRTLADKTI